MFKRTLTSHEPLAEARPEIYRQPQIKVDSPVFGRQPEGKKLTFEQQNESGL